MVKNWKVKKINGQYVVGREEKTGFGSMGFVLPIYGKRIYKSKIAAQKRANSLNK